MNLGIAVCNNSGDDIERLSTRFCHPLYYISNTAHQGHLPLEKSFMQIDGSIGVSAIKTPEDSKKGFIIRMFDNSQIGCSGSVSFARNIISAQSVDIMEMPVEKEIVVKGNQISFNLNSNEIITVRVLL
jgi:alpha-mannosidase